MKKKIIGVLTVMGLSLSLMGCGSTGYTDYNESRAEDLPNPSFTELVKDELYYIPHVQKTKDFPIQYKNFKEKNPHLKVLQVEQDAMENTQYNYINGYFIFVEKKGE